MAEEAPGKINKSMWEQQSNSPSAPVGNVSKIAMFEQAAKDAAPKDVQKKKTWVVNGNSGGYANQGKFKGKTQIGNGPPPKKSINDLP